MESVIPDLFASDPEPLPFAVETDRADARRRIDAMLARIRRGEDR